MRRTSAPDGDAIRLQRFIAQSGLTSRRKAEELIAAGEVRVNGNVVTELGTRIIPGRDRVQVGRRSLALESQVYYALHKPDGIVCSAEGPRDERGRPTVLSLLPGIQQRIYPVGRLDFHTRGLLILTNDGELAARLTHPSCGVLKVYHVKFQGRLSPEDLAELERGVRLEDGTVTRPAAEVTVIRETQTNTWVQLGLRQGLNRQIRRMGTAIGHEVLKLIRVGIGDLALDGIDEGRFRRLTAAEVARLSDDDA